MCFSLEVKVWFLYSWNATSHVMGPMLNQRKIQFVTTILEDINATTIPNISLIRIIISMLPPSLISLSNSNPNIPSHLKIRIILDLIQQILHQMIRSSSLKSLIFPSSFFILCSNGNLSPLSVLFLMVMTNDSLIPTLNL